MTIDPDLPVTINNCLYPTAREMATSIMASAPKGAAQRVQQTIDKYRARGDQATVAYYTAVLGLMPPIN